MKKALMNASVASMIYKFNMNNIDMLKSLGYEVDVACNFGKENPISEEDIQEFKKRLQEKNVVAIDTLCPRNIFALKNMRKAYTQLKNIAAKEKYDIVHTQSPIGGVICRLAFRKARKNGTKVIYQAHGFHFYKGAPKINWLVFYPIEKFCSRFTDVLITINKEDYELAKRKFHAKKTEYVPGAGIDCARFKNVDIDAGEKRNEIGVPKNAFLLFSTGELNANKNHEIIIKAISRLKDKNIHYAIAGQGSLHDYLLDRAKELGVEKNIHLLGYRDDVPELYHISDVCVFPSIREGLGLAALEGMASGLPLIATNNRGTRDYAVNNDNAILCRFDSPDDFAEAILALEGNEELREEMAKKNQKIAQNFDISIITSKMSEIYLG